MLTKLNAARFRVDIQREIRRPQVSLTALRRQTVRMLQVLRWKSAWVSIRLVSDRKIRALNKKYLKHDYATDVLAFGQLEGARPPKMLSAAAPFLGDIVISLDTAKRQAGDFGNTFTYELAFYICHGILHIMGYDDRTGRERERMWRKQEQILKKIGMKQQGVR